MNTKHIFHFDVYADFAPLLQGEQFAFPLTPQNVEKVQQASKAEVITVKSSSRVNKSVLEHFPNLKLLITRTVGMDHLDHKACKQAGIEVKNIPDYGAFSVAEHVFALLLTLTRKVIFLDKEVRQGTFNSRNGKGYTLEGKTMGVVGAGRIGIEIIKLAQAFQMQVIAYDMYPNKRLAKKIGFRYMSLPKLLKQADVISINVPLTEKTRHMISHQEFDMMKPDIVLINTSRGEVIDIQNLVQHVDKFRAIGLDVLEGEAEFDQHHPLLQFDNVVITPHCAFYTDNSTKMIAKKTMEIISSY